MSTNKKLLWLKRILFAKVVLTFLFWGLPILIFPLSLLQRSGVPTSADPLYLRTMGAVIVAFGVAYWYAYKDPIHNVAIIKAGVIDNGLVTLVDLIFILFYGLRSTILLITAPLTLFFFVSFILLMPRAETA